MAEIGSSLREARMRAHIDISEVEARTKIRAKYLRALENEEWDLLPGPVYVKSFVKTYGDFLGLDSRLLVDEFKRRYERPMEYEARTTASSARERERDRDRRPSRVTDALLSPRSVIVVALVVIVAALYVIGSQGGKHSANSARSITPATNTVADRTGAKSKTSTNASTGTGTGTTATTVTTPAPKQATLALVPTAEVWVCVEDAAGKPLINQTFEPGEKIPTESSSALLVNLGNDHVDVTVNGKAYSLPGVSAIGLKITPTGAASLGPGPTCDA